MVALPPVASSGNLLEMKFGGPTSALLDQKSHLGDLGSPLGDAGSSLRTTARIGTTSAWQQPRASREGVSSSLQTCFPMESGSMEQDREKGPASHIWNPSMISVS
jgi:hypothetical protein